jgi:hypothetical protein
MLIPRRLDLARDREQVLAALAQFNGHVLLPAGAEVSEVQQRLESEADPDKDIWIATGRLEHPLSLFSLLHARVEPGRDATVDTLAVTNAPGGTSAHGYKGFGEFVLLGTLLEKGGIQQLALPLEVDLEASGLADAGWHAATPGSYVRR